MQMVMSMLENGRRTWLKERAHIFMLMELNMKETGRKTCSTALVLKHGKMGPYTMVNMSLE